MKQLVTIILFVLIGLRLNAQTTFTGTVVSNEDKALASVSVVLLDKKGSIVAFVKTGKLGQFAVNVPDGKEVAQVSFACVGFAKKNLDVDKFKQGMKVALEEKVQQIREVRVTPKSFRIQGDTIIYSVLGLRQKQDRTIEDVISRIPGITIGVNGIISYQGMPINRFYVDGKNTMGGNYSILSKNLSANKVDSVQLLRNHQPIKSLRGNTNSESAAINIIMNENAKNVWTGSAELGSGITLQKPINWVRKAKLVEMYLNRKIQFLAVYKHNNVAENVANELGGSGYDMTDIGLLHNIDAVGEGRRGFNNSHLVALNAFKSFDDSKDLRIQINGIVDRSTTNDYSEQTYLDDVSNSTVIERREAVSYKREWHANIDYMQNSDKFFLNETLCGVMSLDHSSSVSSLNGRILNENVRPHKCGFTNNLSAHTRKKSNTSFDVSSVMSYTYLPGTLLLYNGSDEKLDITSFTMDNEIKRDYYLGHGFKLYSSFAHSLDFKREYVAYNDTIQHLHYSKNKVDASVNFNYRKGKMDIYFNNKLSWIYASYDLDKDVRLQYTPSATFSWRMFSNSTLRANYSHGFSESGFYSLNPLRIYTSYNMASSGTGTFDYTPSDNMSVSYNRILPGNGLSYMCRYSYGQVRFNHLYESRLYGGIYVRENVEGKNKSNSQSVSGNVTYSCRPMRTKLSLFGSYNISDFDVMRSGMKVKSGNRSLNVSFSASMRPLKWFYFEEASSYMQSRQRQVIAGAKNVTYRHFTHSLNLYFQPGSWQLKMTNDCSHSRDGSVSFNIYSEAQLSYKTKMYELLLTCKNLWGENKHEYKSFSSLGSSYSITEYRPREVLLSVIFSL